MSINTTNQILNFPPLPPMANQSANQNWDNLKGQVDELLNNFGQAVKQANASTPFDFDDGITFSYDNAIFALGQAISGLLSVQPQLIAGEMAISTELVSPQIDAWSQAYLVILKNDEIAIGNAGEDNGALQKAQGQMSVDNAASTASSTALNGVLSMLTSGTSSKTSTYQTLIQQASSVVTALLNAMTQNWS